MRVSVEGDSKSLHVDTASGMRVAQIGRHHKLYSRPVLSVCVCVCVCVCSTSTRSRTSQLAVSASATDTPATARWIQLRGLVTDPTLRASERLRRLNTSFDPPYVVRSLRRRIKLAFHDADTDTDTDSPNTPTILCPTYLLA